MLINRILCLCFIGCYISSAYAASVRINLNGNVKINTCSVAINAEEKYVALAINAGEKYVALGHWAAKQFSAVGTASMPIQFNLNLENCNGAESGISSVTFLFAGLANTANPNLFALNGSSTATNVGIAILDEDKKIIPPNTNSKLYKISNNMKYPLFTFYGQYISTADHVSAGTANADVTFSLTYQ
ncbi:MULTISPECIES: fimbrial protein [unclassified Acinetobacter]|uniref:fimbrial protein n=1 Tax=unclassified Acinetobacter TaxID=196816 RepID=UPI00293410CA|nr:MULTISPECIES: fimbrial protein [unclassified Acinetobacter]WOE33012.1 fimbrial protein [Acinetobacter sp. SAAs470]WOE38490.1 fimbrial protein [Acinetobacter sp. SAAs474]